MAASVSASKSPLSPTWRTSRPSLAEEEQVVHAGVVAQEVEHRVYSHLMKRAIGGRGLP